MTGDGRYEMDSIVYFEAKVRKEKMVDNMVDETKKWDMRFHRLNNSLFFYIYLVPSVSSLIWKWYWILWWKNKWMEGW